MRPSFMNALLDDLNVSRAIAELHGMAAKAEGGKTQTGRIEAEKLCKAAGLIGLLQDGPAAWAPAASSRAVDKAKVERLVAERLEARKARNFAESDRLRDALAAMGVQLKDGKDAATGEAVTTWEIVG